MRLHMRTLTLAVATFAFFALSAPPVLADCEPVSGEVTSYPTDDPNVRRFVGSVEPFGDVRGTITFTSFDPVTGEFTANIHIVARGGTVRGTVEGQFTSATTYVERITFTHGTGRYAGIEGFADVEGTFNEDGSATDIIGGEVCLPD